MNTSATIEKQLDRELTVRATAVACCETGYPIVIRNAPQTMERAPFPTLYWLTCPSLRKSLARLEAAGLIEDLTRELAADEDLRTRLALSDEQYRLTRDDGRASPTPGGIAGCRDIYKIKCLHAHAADWLAAGNNPIGERLMATCPVPTDCDACAAL